MKFLLRLFQKFRKPKTRKAEVKHPPEIKEKPKPEAKFVNVKLGSGIVSAEVVKENPLTYWVRLSGGRIIKRHKAKQVLE